MKSLTVDIQSAPGGRILLLSLIIITVVFILTACDVATATPTVIAEITVTATSPPPTDTATPPTVTPTTPSITPTQENTVTPTPTEEATPVPSGEILPSDEEIERIRAAFAEQPPTEETGHVPPPELRIEELENACRQLTDQERLINPHCVFNRDRVTTYALPTQGALYQVVSLVSRGEEDSAIDELLRQSQEWEGELVVGGVLVYQDIPEFNLPVGSYLVALRPGATFLFYNEAAEEAGEGEWQLRLLEGQARTAFTLVNQNQICYARLNMQACLNLASPGIGDGANRELIEQAAQNLAAAGWLPANATVDFGGALASIEGAEAIRLCSDALRETERGIAEQCQPDVVAAAVNIPAETMLPALPGNRAAKRLIPSLLANDSLIQESAVIGVMEVLETLPGEVFNGDGAIVDLEPGSYRVDLLQTGDEEWLAQLVRADDGAPFYYIAIQVPGEGVALDPTTLEPLPESEQNEVLLDKFLWNVCHSLGQGSQCLVSAWRLRAYCFTNGSHGWCDQIGWN